MDRDAFEAEVVALAKSGGRVTPAAIGARIGLSERTCQTLLDMMVRDGKLQREPGDDDAPVYRVRASEPPARKRASEPEPERESEPRVARARAKVAEATRDVQDQVIAAAGQIVVKQAGERIQAAIGVDPKSRRSLGIAALAGMLLGPLGLFYAAPWMTAIISTAVYLGLRWLPFWPTEGMWKFWLVVHLVFALVSFLYAVRFNRTGDRATLFPPRQGGAKGAKKAKPSAPPED
jgi:DNA-binding Lrp family transcriptional regulator